MLPLFGETVTYMLLAQIYIVCLIAGLAAGIWYLHVVQDQMDRGLARMLRHFHDMLHGHTQHLESFEHRYSETLAALTDADKKLKLHEEAFKEVSDAFDDLETRTADAERLTRSAAE